MYPALAVLQSETNNSDTEVLWVGSDDGPEGELVQREGIPYKSVPAAGLHGVSLATIPSRVLKLTKGCFAARKIVREFKPDVMFFTGGYVGFPVAMAGRGIPSVLFVPDIEPGMALNVLAKSADVITVVCEDSKKFFDAKKNTVITGYPTRADMCRWDKEQALTSFGLSAELPVLFVFGGSKGAQSINHAMRKHITDLTRECQVIHVCGKNNWEEMSEFYETLPAKVKARYKLFPYLHEEMGTAFTAADLVISRSGASTLGELPLFGVPALLVPYPYAWRYQKTNADYLISKGAAELLKDEDLDEQLCARALELLRDKEKLTSMTAAMKSLALPDAAKQIFKVLRSAAQRKAS